MTHGKPNDRRKYDYIVVGGGSAGSLVACGLARDRSRQVLLVEAGERLSNRNVRVPALYPHLFKDHRFCGSNCTTPQAELSNRRIFLPSGRGLGGSSLINAMIWLAPHDADLEQWSRCSGGEWGIEEMKSEIQSLQERYFGLDSFVHSFGSRDLSKQIRNVMECNDGPNAAMPWVSPVVREFLNHGIHQGCHLFPYQRAVKDGRRISAWQAFREQPLPPNLSCARGVEVQRIVMKGSVAIGVTIQLPGSQQEETILAEKGVILCSGALATPGLLQRSGIGPEGLLEELGVDVAVPNEEVGGNLQDHLIYPIILEQDTDPFPSRPDSAILRDAILNGTGWLTSNIAEAGGLFHLDKDGKFVWDKAGTNSVQPQFQWHITPTHYLEYPTREISHPALSIGITPLHPQSRGTVSIARNDGNSWSLVIDPAYLSIKSDRDELVEAIQKSRGWLNADADLSTSTPWQFNKELLPGAKRSSDEQVSSSVARYATTLYHYVGTCSMGKNDESVCTPDFQVRNAEHLYVCDASILPNLPSGNTQVAVMMLAKMLLQRLV